MSLLTIYNGRLGESGSDGEDGYTPSEIRGSIVDNPLLSVLYSNKLSRVGDISMSRTGEALYVDRYGRDVYSSDLDITNKLPYSNDFSQWSDALNKWTILSSTRSDPFGGNSATEIRLDEEMGEGELVFMEQNLSSLTNQDKFHTFSVWFKAISGTIGDLSISIGNTIHKIEPNLTSNWQRVQCSFAPNSSNFILSFNVTASNGAIFQVYGAQFEEGSQANEYVQTLSVPVTIPGAGTAIRQNKSGYIINGGSTNLIVNSEDLTESNWSTLNADIIEYNGLAPLDSYKKRIVLKLSTLPTAKLSSTATFTQGQTYTVSAWVNVSGGGVSSITASLADGDSVQFNDVSTGSFSRVSVTCVAGSGSGLVINVTSPLANAEVAFFGVQVNAGGLGSYVRNGSTINSQPLDEYISATEMKGASSWSCLFTLNNIENNADIKYIFYCDANFNAYVQNDALYIKNGQLKSIDTVLDAQNLALTFDSSSLKTYKDGLLYSTQTVSTPSQTVTSNVYIGADSAGNNALNGQIMMLDFFDNKLTFKEIKYLTESL